MTHRGHETAVEPDRIRALTVAVITCQRPGLSVELVGNLASQLGSCDELLVVDDAPAAGVHFPATEISAVDREKVRVLLTCGSGAAQARNKALTEAKNDWILFVDDDVVAPRDFICSVRKILSSDECDIVTGNVVSHPAAGEVGRLFDERYPLSRGQVSRTFHGSTGTFWSPNDVWRVGVGACMAWRTPQLRRLHGFVGTLGQGRRFGGAEDLDAFRRALCAGLTIRYESTLTVQHYPPATRAELESKMVGYTLALGAFAAQVWLSEHRLGMAAHVLNDILSTPKRLAVEMIRKITGRSYLPLRPILMFPFHAAYAFIGYARQSMRK